MFSESTGTGSLDFCIGGSLMVRRSVLAMFAVVAIVLGFVVVSTPAGAVVDNATIVASPNGGTGPNVLNSVSCVSASDCVAVGYTDIGNYVYETLVMVWDGSVWSIVSSPNAGTSNDALTSVSCVSASECVAVGYTFAGSAFETLVMVWDGSVWSIVVPSLNAGTSDNVLVSVSCVSASSCVAVGYTDTGNNVHETLVLSLTGSVPPSTTTTTVPPSTTTVASDQVVPAFTG